MQKYGMIEYSKYYLDKAFDYLIPIASEKTPNRSCSKYPKTEIC